MPQVLTVKQAAEFLQLPESTVLRRVRAGLLPAARIGRTWRFSRRLLLDWIEEASITEEMVDARMVEVVEERMANPGKRVPLAEVKARLGL